jgi:hypothetical protein
MFATTLLSPDDRRELERRVLPSNLSHATIVANLARELGQQLKTSACRVYCSAVKVKTPSGFYAFPDVLVVNGDAAVTDEEPNTILNPF